VGRARGGGTRQEISPTLQVAIDGDLETARNVVKGGLLLYLGGMGSRKTNFYVDLASRFGFEQEAKRVQSLYLDGKRDEAYEAIPDELVDETSLVGTEREVAERVERYAKAGVDRLIVSPIHLDAAERRHTLDRLAALAGVAAAA
jgi:alkanesulfonate monooxygenase SsuD/methylene tetrahydromethanopterin reductase-like flavin-dependent oxidoreductase (luciferase family)